MNRGRFFVFTLALAFLLGVTAPLAVPVAHGQTIKTNGGLLVDCDRFSFNADGSVKQESKPCGIDDFLNQFLILSQYGLGIIGVLALLMFVYAGVQFLTAAGRSAMIDEGKRVLIGTITGLAIALSAYVIINFSVSAITGTTTNVRELFSGPIATIFGGRTIKIGGIDTSIQRPFSGTKTEENRTGCRSSNSSWKKDCHVPDLQYYCADPGTTDGVVTKLQKDLTAKGCECGGADGCFGGNTLDCVRRFQIANKLPVTGVVDTTTQNAIDGGGISCNDVLAAVRIQAMSKVIPNGLEATSLTSLSSPDTKGCCVINNNIGGTDTAVYCADQVSERTCSASGTSTNFVEGEFCGIGGTADVCGFCSTPYAIPLPFKWCFQFVAKYWCDSVAQKSPTYGDAEFHAGIGRGNPMCDGSLKNTLLLYPEP